MKFESLALCEPLLRSIKAAGYHTATPIQYKAIPKVLLGRDLLGCAQTGTGKTAAFALPTLQRLMTTESPRSGAARRRQRRGKRAIRALILAPTRELAAQIGDSLTAYGRYAGIRHTVVFGGVRQSPQVRALQAGVDVLVATPGRLLDLIEQGFIELSCVEVLILDEADRMLDMGFIHDLRKIVARVPEGRQTLMFSATMPGKIRELAAKWLRRPYEVTAAPVASTPERVTQTVCFVERQDKTQTLVRFLKTTHRLRTLVFSRTKHGADRIARHLQRDGIQAISIHGNKSQAQRLAAMRQFNSHRPPVLVATDIAARGLDFSEVSHVINYDLPDEPESYVHRIGRTARAGATGKAISFCGRDERQRLREIEKLTGKAVPVEPPLGTPDERTLKAAALEATREETENSETTPIHAGSHNLEASGTGNRSRRRTRRPGRSSQRASSRASNQHARTRPRRRRKANSQTT